MTEAREERREGRQLFCRIITPEEMIFDGEADLVVARIADGEIGVLVDHAPVVSTVGWTLRTSHRTSRPSRRGR